MTETNRCHVTSTDQRNESHLVERDDCAVAIASLHAMGSGSLADFGVLYTSDVVNREAEAEPPDTRGTGPAALYATALWLRTAFGDLT